MTMEPTQTAPAPPNVGAPLVEYIRTQRQNAGSSLAAFAFLLLALTGFLAFKTFQSPAVPEKPADKELKDEAFDHTRLKETKKPEVVDSRRDDYMIGWMATLGAFLAVAAVAAWLLVSPPAPDEARQRADARVAILSLGAALGALAIVAGIFYFYQWRESLTGWLDKGQTKEARWVLIPVLMIVAGAGLIFFAIQPARAEERNNASIRRTVYWTNFGLTALLLLVAFVVANVLFSLKVPNKLDTTATGFYALSNNTKNLLGRLTEPVTAYAVKLEGPDRIPNDIRQLLLACQDAGEGKFKVRFVSEVANRTELQSLLQRYPQLDLVLSQRGPFGDEDDSGAVLLTTGEDEKRHAVIPASEFSTMGENRQPLFQGEARLFKEIAFLADSQTKPVVYFTQGNKELDIGGGPDVPPARSGARLKAYLEKNYLDVKPLNLPAEKPTVPADADVVVVADPQSALPEPAVAALRTYMTNPGKKGKLIVLAAAHAGPDRQMIKTGLEPLLSELNVQLGSKFIYNLPNQLLPRVDRVLAGFSRSAERNPILQAIVKVSPVITFGTPREIEPTKTNPSLTATDLMLSDGRTWAENEPIVDIRAVVEPMLQSIPAQRARGVTSAARSLAVTVSEGETARAVVFGNSYFVSDEVSRQSRSESAPLSYDLFGVTVDWLRDRPSIAAAGVEAKQYTQYRFPQPSSVDTVRILYLPLGLAFLTVVGLGAGVWVIRRR
jgi:gliding motility-associatede transport system auxiliary component